MSRPNNDAGDDEEEAAILASLGLGAGSGALRSASEYESTVIRQAELSSVPQLGRDGGGGVHFPSDLSGLAPGLALVDGRSAGGGGGGRKNKRRRLADSEMDALLDVFVDLRTELSNLLHSNTKTNNSNSTAAIAGRYESSQANQLRLEQQLLLTYLFHHCGYDGTTKQGQDEVWELIRHRTGYDSRMERDEERERKGWIAAAMAAAADGAGELGDGDGNVEHVSHADTGGSRKRSSSARRSNGGTGAFQETRNMSAHQRLEHIKKSDDSGNDSRKVTFADSTGTPGSSSKRRRKVTMMSIRNQMDVESGVADARKENAEAAERRRQRRIARRGRRRERTERALDKFVEKRRATRRKERKQRNTAGGKESGDGGSSRSANRGDSSSDEAEFEFVENNDAKKPAAAASAKPPAAGSEPEIETQQPRPTVSCPLCNAEVEIEDGTDADTTLSAHIDDCQRTRGGRGARRRRGGESSASGSSRRAAASKPVSYAETNSDDDDEGMEECFHLEEVDNESSEEEKKSDSSTSRRKSSNHSGKKSSNTVLEVDSDDESMSLPSSPPPDYAPSDLDPEGPSDNEELDSLPFNTAPDDIEEANYDDRVDVWQEVGVKRMKNMAERDDEDEEALPGPVMHDGGLVIPGWMNNRLFGYQRTGFRWLWELHRQEAGGIVGDEMVSYLCFR